MVIDILDVTYIYIYIHVPIYISYLRFSSVTLHSWLSAQMALKGTRRLVFA